MSSRRKLKKEILARLKHESLYETFAFLDTLAGMDVVNALFSAICREDPAVKWHGVSCMGRTVARVAAEDFEQSRIIMRRFLWSLNDESGGIGWGAPESMAESMCCCHRLGEEYSHMLVSYMRGDGPELYQDGNFLEHPFLQRGLLWGIGRLAEQHPDLVRQKLTAQDFLFYLHSSDVEVCGLAIRAAGLLGIRELEDSVMAVNMLNRDFLLYDNERCSQVTLGQLISDYRDAIR